MNTESLLDLRGLQARLDNLDEGGHIAIALATYRRLFGLNDVALERAKHFARGHRCSITLEDSLVVFRKLAAARRAASND